MEMRRIWQWCFCLLAVGCVLRGRSIEELDSNFRPAKVGNVSVHYYNALAAPFEVTGFPWWKRGEKLYRIPRNLTKEQVSGGVLYLAQCTSGGAIRFETDSPYLTIRATYRAFCDMNHMPRSGSAGFDLYRYDGQREQYVTTVQPSRNNAKQPLERMVAHFSGKTMVPLTLNLPLYSGIETLELGIKPGSHIGAPKPQRFAKPILFYGSSITQGGCASRPGNNYTTMLCRAVDAPQINLGFSGSAKGELAMAEAIGGLELSAFVYDYDYNAPSVAHLEKTHEAFFKVIRKARPDLPILILSRCSHAVPKRRDMVRRTYENARAAGDRKVWFIDGDELFGEPGQRYCTVDGCHPNDLGFYMMFQRVLPVLKEALQIKD